MLIASLKNYQLIHASEAIGMSLKGQEFYCPECQKRVVLKKSKKNQYFFSHLTQCGKDYVRIKAIESKEHLKAKSLLITELKKIDMAEVDEEKYFKEITQSADAYVHIKKNRYPQQIYEYQRSVIPASDIQLRQENYKRTVDRIYWLIDYELTESLPMNAHWLQTMLNYSSELGYYLNFLDLNQEEIVTKHSLPILYKSELLVYIESRQKIAEHALQKMPIKIKKVTESTTYKVSKNDYRRKLRGLMTSSSHREDIYLLYSQGIILSELPEWIITEKWHFLFIETPSWLVILWSIVIVKKYKAKFSLMDFVDDLTEMNRIQLNPLPLIEHNPYPDLAKAILNLLIEKGLIITLSIDIENYYYWSENKPYDTLSL